MPQKLYTESYIQDIADAIRAINKKPDKYKVSEMAQAIQAMSGGINATEIAFYLVEYTTS